MKRCILHIGMPKTGSSSLQQLLADNRESLAREGIVYPLTSPWPPGSHGELGRIFYRAYQKRKGLRRRLFEHLADRIRATEGDVLILSAEALSETDTRSEAASTIAEFLAGLGYELQVVAFVRPQAEFLNSKYAQVIRSLNTGDLFADWFEKQVAKPDMRYRKRFRQWSRLPDGAFTPIPYSRPVLREGLARCFFRVADLGDRTEALQSDDLDQRQNPTSGPLTVEAFRRLAAGGRWPRASDAVSWAQRDLMERARSLGWEAEPFSGLTDDLRQLAADHLAEDNDRFASRHWGRRWDEVFEDAGETKPVNAVEHAPPPADRLADLERVVGEIKRRYGNMGWFGRQLQKVRLRLAGKPAINRRSKDLFRLDT